MGENKNIKNQITLADEASTASCDNKITGDIL